MVLVVSVSVSHMRYLTTDELKTIINLELDLITQITSHSDVEVMRPYIASTRKCKQKVIDALDNATME